MPLPVNASLPMTTLLLSAVESWCHASLSWLLFSSIVPPSFLSSESSPILQLDFISNQFFWSSLYYLMSWKWQKLHPYFLPTPSGSLPSWHNCQHATLIPMTLNKLGSDVPFRGSPPETSPLDLVFHHLLSHPCLLLPPRHCTHLLFIPGLPLSKCAPPHPTLPSLEEYSVS